MQQLFTSNPENDTSSSNHRAATPCHTCHTYKGIFLKKKKIKKFHQWRDERDERDELLKKPI